MTMRPSPPFSRNSLRERERISVVSIRQNAGVAEKFDQALCGLEKVCNQLRTYAACSIKST